LISWRPGGSIIELDFLRGFAPWRLTTPALRATPPQGGGELLWLLLIV
jgi:hypothetical protein